MGLSFNRFLAIARKEFHHVTRDGRTLFLVTFAPAFLLLMLAYVFSFDSEHVNLIVLDQDKTTLSRRYLTQLTSDGTFEILATLEHYDEIDVWLQAGRAHVALVIPPGAAAALQAGRPAAIQAVLDGVDIIAASQTLGQLNARTSLFALSLLPVVNGRAMPGLIEVRMRAWYNPSLKSQHSMVPGLIAVVLYMPALALSLSLAREKEMGSFEGLAATPIRGIEYLLGKAFTYTGFGLVSTLPVVLMATVWFNVPFRGSIWILLIVTLCYFAASFGMSLAAASIVKNQQTAMLIMLLLFFAPSFFLAGLVMPVDTSSLGSMLAAYALPVTHFVFISRSIFLKGLALADLLEPVLTLAGIGGFLTLVSLALFRKWMD
jgi:ABC-2 type transport system permease protein